MSIEDFSRQASGFKVFLSLLWWREERKGKEGERSERERRQIHRKHTISLLNFLDSFPK
jgi:hypothetical protein